MSSCISPHGRNQQQEEFIYPPKKGFYMLAFDGWFSYDDHDPRVLCDILKFEVDRNVYFNDIHDCMLTKNERGFIWKIRHSAIPTGRFLYGCKYSDSNILLLLNNV